MKYVLKSVFFPKRWFWWKQSCGLLESSMSTPAWTLHQRSQGKFASMSESENKNSNRFPANCHQCQIELKQRPDAMGQILPKCSRWHVQCIFWQPYKRSFSKTSGSFGKCLKRKLYFSPEPIFFMRRNLWTRKRKFRKRCRIFPVKKSKICSTYVRDCDANNSIFFSTGFLSQIFLWTPTVHFRQSCQKTFTEGPEKF